MWSKCTDWQVCLAVRLVPVGVMFRAQRVIYSYTCTELEL